MSDGQAKIPPAYRRIVDGWGPPCPVERAKDRFTDLVASAEAGRPVLLCRDGREWAALLPVPAASVPQLTEMAGKDRAEVRVTGFSPALVGAWEPRDLPAARRELPQLVRAAYRRRIAFVLWTDHDPRAIIAPVDVAPGPG
ncbi:MAG TPA: hypothetical protein VFV01_01235 [Spirillospora sp.]|nr:hypothetical protein [Spirillospora sp.]